MTLEKSIKAACIVSGCTEQGYKSRCRDQECAFARHLVAWYRKTYMGHTYAQMGGSHATHIYAVRRINSIMSLRVHPDKEKVIKFLLMMEADTATFTAKANGATLLISGAGKTAIYVSGQLTVVMVSTGELVYQSSDSITVEQLLRIMMS
jgi:hypothetical protein